MAKSSNGWLMTIGISAAIAVISAKFYSQIKDLVKDIPVVGEWVNS